MIEKVNNIELEERQAKWKQQGMEISYYEWKFQIKCLENKFQ
jgi:hypothetical protein